jgi:hypothetical protein
LFLPRYCDISPGMCANDCCNEHRRRLRSVRARKKRRRDSPFQRPFRLPLTRHRIGHVPHLFLSPFDAIPLMLQRLHEVNLAPPLEAFLPPSPLDARQIGGLPDGFQQVTRRASSNPSLTIVNGLTPPALRPPQRGTYILPGPPFRRRHPRPRARPR